MSSRRQRVRISVVDDAAASPRVADEEDDDAWRWKRQHGGSIGTGTPVMELRQRPRLVQQRHSASPRSRGDIVMEKVMNPFLDRHATAALTDTPPPPPPSPMPAKAPAFDDEYHSVYVPEHAKGAKGLFVLVQSPLLLVAIGVFSALVGLLVDFWLAKIAVYHSALSDAGFGFLLVSALAAVTMSAALTYLVCPQAAGSGLPFMKVAISGVDMSDYLSLRCVATKIVGLILAFAAGLSIGKEGPFIMMACGFANCVMSLRPFERIFNDDTKRLEMLACACAAGVAATFGSPFGGVLFGVEVTSHFYLVRTLPRSFFAASVGALVFNFVTQNTRYGLFGESNLGISDVGDLHPFTLRDLGLFVVIGVACGLGGALFNACISVLVQLRDHFLKPPATKRCAAPTPWQRFWPGLGKRLLLVLTITFIACFTEFYGDSAWFIRHGSPRRILATLFSKHKQPFAPEHNRTATADDDDSVLLSRSLITFLPLKFVLTLLSVVLPIPAGLFTPTFVIGGIFGRLVGEAISAFDWIDTQYEPFEFAIIGAGAFSSGVTHAISTAVIIMEISHTDGLNLPVSIAILAAYFTAKRFNESVYDLLITTSHLPRLQKLPKAAYDIPAWEVMRDVHVMKFLTADSTYADAERVLATSKEPVYPIVDSRKNLFLLATVTRRRLQTAVTYCQMKHKEATEQATSFEAVATALTSDNQPKYGSAETAQTSALPPLDLELHLLDWPIHFAFRRGGKVRDWGTNEECTRTKLTVLVNPSPFQLMEMTPMRRVDLLFRMIKLNNAYITRSGRLVGVITRDRMMAFLGKSSKYKVPGFISTIGSFFGSLTTSRGQQSKPKREDYTPLL